MRYSHNIVKKVIMLAKNKKDLWRYCHQLFLEDQGPLLVYLQQNGIEFSDNISKCIELKNFHFLLFLSRHLEIQSLGDIDSHFVHSMDSKFYDGALFFITKTKRSLLSLVTQNKLIELGLYAIEVNHSLALNVLLSLGIPVHRRINPGSPSLIKKAFELRKYKLVALMINAGAYLYKTPALKKELDLDLMSTSVQVEEEIYHLIDLIDLEKDLLLKNLRQTQCTKDVTALIKGENYCLGFIINIFLYQSEKKSDMAERLFDFIAEQKPNEFQLILGKKITRWYHQEKTTRLLKHCLSKRHPLPDELWSDVLTFAQGPYNASLHYRKAQKAISRLYIKNQS